MEYKTDSLLVHLARAGDEDACEKLVKKYYSSIYQYCLLHIYVPYEAKDLTQEAFTRFFSNLQNMEKLRIIFIQLLEIPLKIWLYQQNGEHILILYEYTDSNNDPAAL